MDFADFLSYLDEHESEYTYDITSSLGYVWNKNLTLTQEDVALVSKISKHITLSILRQYENWIESHR